MNSDQKIYGHIEQLTDLLDRILIQKHQILNNEDKARIQKVYELIDQSLLKELKECDFLKNIDVAELEKWSPNLSYSSRLIWICKSYFRDLIIKTHYDKPGIVWSGGTCYIMGSEGGRFFGRTLEVNSLLDIGRECYELKSMIEQEDLFMLNLCPVKKTILPGHQKRLRIDNQ